MSKTIVEKLNLHKYEKKTVLNMPEDKDYVAGLGRYDSSLEGGKYDLIFAFVTEMESLKELVGKVITDDHLNGGGYLYIAYPKKGNKKYPTFIHRDELLPGLGADEDGYIGESSIKFSRMVGLDEVFTIVGLKKEPRKQQKTSAKPSQRVDDYIQLIPNIEQDLEDSPDILAFYRTLTPGYRKDWARYVYSAKQEETRGKRREEMKMILRAGYKSRDLYKRDQQ